MFAQARPDAQCVLQYKNGQYMHASKFLEFLFHIYAPNTCSLHFRIQVSYRFSKLISLAEQELKTQQPQLVGDSRGVTTRNYKEPTKKITKSRKDDTNTKKKLIVSSAMIHVKFLGCFFLLAACCPFSRCLFFFQSSSSDAMSSHTLSLHPSPFHLNQQWVSAFCESVQVSRFVES